MENMTKSNDAGTFFTETVWKDVEGVLDEHSSIPYFSPLQKAIRKRDRSALGDLIMNGLKQLTDKEDNTLGDYFFILSEIQGIPDDIRSYLMDVMLWCEENETHPNEQGWGDAATVRRYFDEQVAPLL